MLKVGKKNELRNGICRGDATTFAISLFLSKYFDVHCVNVKFVFAVRNCAV